MKDKLSAPSMNVFKDMGFSKEEAANLTARSVLMMEITRIMDGKKLTQGQAAKLFGVTQPRISDVKKGKVNVFSVDHLIKMLARAGRTVTIRVKPEAA
jgi:predicted XRE-type DNA-binding protein